MPYEEYQDLFENLELSEQEPPTKVVKTTNPDEEALGAIIQALNSSKDGSIDFDSVVNTVKEILGVKALHTKRRDSLLKMGVQKNLILVDWPKISLPNKSTLESEEVLKEEEPENIKPKKEKLENSWVPPEGWTGPKVLDCGHSEMWWGSSMKLEINEKGRSTPTPTGDIQCLMCLRKYPSNPIERKGEYAKLPLPISFRATVKSLSGQGWHGYCCDEEGMYIGGLGNNCQYTRKGEVFSKFDVNGNRVLCTAHR